jgi:hypothetical protein
VAPGTVSSIAVRKAGRTAVAYTLFPAVIWLVAMSTFAMVSARLSSEFRTHLLTGLTMFAFVIILPLLLTLITLNWVLRRVAGAIITLLFVGMVRGGVSQGFSLIGDVGVVLVAALLVGSLLFLLSRPAIQCATSDAYDFLNPNDVFSKYVAQRKPPEV